MAGGDDDRDPRSELARAEHLLALRRPADALAAARRAAVADPTSALAEATIAACHLGLDEGDQAVHHAERAATLAPEWDVPHRLRSRGLLARGHRAEGLRAADAAVRLGPDDWRNHAARAGVLAEHQRREADALDAAAHAVSLAPDEPDALVEASYVALACRQWTLAQEYAQQALELDPDDSRAMNNLGVALGRGRASGVGLDHFARSARLDPRSLAAANARASAARLAGFPELRTLILAAIGTYVVLLAVAALMPPPVRAVVLAVLVVAAVGGALWWIGERRRRIAQFDEATRQLIDRARRDPGDEAVYVLWAVFGMSALFTVLFLVDLFSPSESTVPTTNVVAMVVLGAVALATGHRLRLIHRARRE